MSSTFKANRQAQIQLGTFFRTCFSANIFLCDRTQRISPGGIFPSFLSMPTTIWMWTNMNIPCYHKYMLRHLILGNVTTVHMPGNKQVSCSLHAWKLPGIVHQPTRDLPGPPILSVSLLPGSHPRRNCCVESPSFSFTFNSGVVLLDFLGIVLLLLLSFLCFS